MGDLISDLVVVDLSTGIAGGYASKLFVDGGATVHRRAVSDDPLDSHGTSPETVGHLRDFLRPAQPVERLDLEQPEDRTALLALLQDADVLLESEPPGRLEHWGLDLDSLTAHNPALVVVSCSPYGRGGPWSHLPGSDLTMLAQSGAMGAIRSAGRTPVVAGARQSEWITGAMAATAALAATRRAQLGGTGDHLDVSSLELTLQTCANYGPLWAEMTGIDVLEAYDETPAIEPTADGWVGFCVFTGQQWEDFALMIDAADWLLDESLMMMGNRNRRAAELRERIHAWTTARTTDEVLAAAEEFRVPAAPIGNGANLTDIEQFRARGVFSDHPVHGYATPRVPYRVLNEAAPSNPAEQAPRPGALPLDGLRILDLTQFWAGPYAGWVLAQLGADVIHVESVQRPDGMRFAGGTPGQPDWWELGPTFHATNTGKRGVTLNLNDPEGRELLLDLVDHADGMLENYSPRVIDQFDLGWDVVGTRNPRLVQVRMPAFGLDGPWRDRVGFAQTMEQLTGIAWLTGYADAAPRNSRACSDPFAGLHAAFALLGGIARRARTGAGCCIEATMAETIVTMGVEQLIEHHATGTVLTRDSNRVAGLHQDVIPTASAPDAMLPYVAVGGTDPGPDLRSWAATQNAEAVVDRLRRDGVDASLVADTRRALPHPQHTARGAWQSVEHPVAGTITVPALPLTMAAASRTEAVRPAPTLGQHNAEVLGGLLGLSPDRLEELQQRRVIGTRPGAA